MEFLNRKREEIISEELREFIRKEVTNYIKKSSPGTYASLNRYYIVIFKKGFADILIERPGKCYQILAKFFNSYDTAEFFIHCILERLLASNPFYVAPAIIALKEGNDNGFKRVLIHALSRERKRKTMI